ncbi:MAG: hypothetical protein HOP32_10540 [Nitrospira sp.]|nr:hypothetical protein [Nitrospira sp.]
MTTFRKPSTTTFPLLQDDESARTYLPSRVYLKDTDDAEQVLTELELLHTHALEEWGDRERERFFQRATRYVDDDPRPEFPQILRSVTHQRAPRYALLPNGQRVRWVGTQRIETLCHIRETLSLTDAVTRFARKTGNGLCRGCQGHHVASRSTASAHPSTGPTAPAVECPKCHTDARGSYVAEADDTLKCLKCGHRVYRSGPIVSPEPGRLSDDEIALNEERISQTLSHEEDSDVAVEDLDTGHDWECEEPHGEALDYSSSHEIEVDTFEDSPEDDIDMQDIADRLHAPAFALFTHGHAPLRQRLIELMLEGRDNASNRTLHWTLAGQLASEGLPPSPQDHSEQVTQWITSLSTEDLLSLIGNPDTEHPILAHPQANHFMALDQLTYPLESAIYYQLRGFRDKHAGATILGHRHDLNPKSLKEFLQRQGSMPPARPTVSKIRTAVLNGSSLSCLDQSDSRPDTASAILTELVDVAELR